MFRRDLLAMYFFVVWKDIHSRTASGNEGLSFYHLLAAVLFGANAGGDGIQPASNTFRPCIPVGVRVWGMSG